MNPARDLRALLNELGLGRARLGVEFDSSIKVADGQAGRVKGASTQRSAAVGGACGGLPRGRGGWT